MKDLEYYYKQWLEYNSIRSTYSTFGHYWARMQFNKRQAAKESTDANLWRELVDEGNKYYETRGTGSSAAAQ